MSLRYRLIGVVTSLIIAFLLYWFLAARVNDAAFGNRVVRSETRVCNVSGAVRDRDGGLVSNASVCITRATELAPVDSYCASANARGQFEFSDLRHGHYRLFAIGGDSSGAKDVDLGACEKNATVDVHMDASKPTLVGVVQGISRERVGASRITVLGALPGVDFRSTVLSDAQGAFAIAVPRGQMWIEVRADNFATARMPVVAPNVDVVITLIPDSSITGMVISSESKTPVAGMSVRAVPSGLMTEMSIPSVTTGESGQFTIKGLEPGEYRLIAENADWRSVGSNNVNVELGKHTEGQTVEVSRGVPLHARVSIASSGGPCLRGYVMLTNDELASAEATRERNVPAAEKRMTMQLNSAIEENGNVQFNGLPAGEYTAYIQCYGYRRTGNPPSFTINANESIAAQEWSVDPAARVLLNVRDESGQPIEDAQVGLLNADNALMAALHIGKGEHEILAVPPGTYRVVSRQNMAVDDQAPMQLTVPSTPATVSATLVLGGDSGVLVKARNRNMSGVGGLQVYASPLQAEESGDQIESDTIIPANEVGDGSYLIRPLTAGRYRVSVGDGRNAPQSQEIDLAPGSERNLEIQLSHSGQITGTVVDGNGNALSGLTVAARHEAALPTWPLSTYQRILKGTATLTDAQGRFVIDGLSASSEYTVAVEKSNAVAATRKQVAAGAHVEFALAAPITVHGRVVDEFNTPVARANVQITNADTGVSQSQQAGIVTGAWAFKDVMPGEITVIARDDAGRIATVSLRVTAESSRSALVLKLNSNNEE